MIACSKWDAISVNAQLSCSSCREILRWVVNAPSHSFSLRLRSWKLKEIPDFWGWRNSHQRQLREGTAQQVKEDVLHPVSTWTSLVPKSTVILGQNSPSETFLSLCYFFFCCDTREIRNHLAIYGWVVREKEEINKSEKYRRSQILLLFVPLGLQSKISYSCEERENMWLIGFWIFMSVWEQIF